MLLSSIDLFVDISRAAKRGEMRRLHGRLYTRNLTDTPEAIVRRNLWSIVGLLFPGTVISYRTALEMRPTDRGTVFLSGRYDRTIELPGLRIRQIKGPRPIVGDMPFIQSLHIASQARAYLENLRTKAVPRTASPSLTRRQIEERLDAYIQHHGEEEANRLCDTARRLQDTLVGALLRTRQASLTAPTAIACGVHYVGSSHAGWRDEDGHAGAKAALPA